MTNTKKNTTDMEQWLRLIKIIQHLVRRDSLTIKELYHILGERATIRTLQRDMEKLLYEPEIPVIELPLRGREKAFQIEAWFKDKFSRSALNLNEAIVGKLIIQNMGIFGGTSLAKSISTFEEKFTRLIPNDIFESTDRKMEGLTSGFSTFVPGMYDYSKKGDFIIQLINAIIERHACRFTYRKPRADTLATYYVQPLKILQYQGSLYFYAKKIEEKVIRLFVIHRINTLEVLDELFEMTNELKNDLFLREQRSLGVYEQKNIKAQKVVLVFDTSVAHRIEDRTWHVSQKITKRSQGELVLTLTVPLTEELIGWILHWQSLVKVEKTIALQQHIKKSALQIAKNYAL